MDIASDVSKRMTPTSKIDKSKPKASTVKYVLRKNNIHPYFVFDGEYPLEKENEQKKTRQLRENKKQYIIKLENALDEYKKSSYVDKLLLKFRQSYLNPHIINIENELQNVVQLDYCKKICDPIIELIVNNNINYSF